MTGFHVSATVETDGQNGKTADQQAPLHPACGKHAKRKRHRRRRVFGIAALCAVLCAFGPGAASALASRAFDSKISSFFSPSSAAFAANGDVWITDGEVGLYKYDGYPSQTLLDIPPLGLGIPVLTTAVDKANGNLYLSQSNGRLVLVFNSNDQIVETWTSIDGVTVGAGSQAGLHVATDNTNTYTGGRIYLSLTAPENGVMAFDDTQRQVSFSATASYIDDSLLTGTPSGPFGEVQNIAVDEEGNIYVSDVGNGVVDEFASTGIFLRSFPVSGQIVIDPTNGNVLIDNQEFDSSANPLGELPISKPLAVDSSGRLYATELGGSTVQIFKPAPAVPKVTYGPVTGPTSTSGTLRATVDLNGGGNVTACHFEYGTSSSYGLGSIPCQPETEPYMGSTPVNAEISGLTAETTYHYRVVVADAGGTKYGADQTYTPHHVVGLTTEAATDPTEEGATLNGSLVGDGTDTHYYFEWGPTALYGHTSSVPPGTDLPSPSGPTATRLSFPLTGLAPFSTYHYRLVASSGSGTSHGEDETFTTTPGVPVASGAAATEVHSDRALLHGQVNPQGARTTARFEYVDDEEFQVSAFANAAVIPVAGIAIGMGKHAQSVEQGISGLTPGTLYHYRVAGSNAIGTGIQAHTFRTFSFDSSAGDPCPNAHVRQQTGSAQLLDCRAYELVSARSTGGYDVESNLVAGQTPFGGYSEAEEPSQVLYGIHNGALGIGNPTNHGVDPYVATRAENGWSTEYVGIPANDPFASGPFASTLEEADPSLDTLAFGGPNICSPCFGPGQTETGEPIHLPNGELVQGMAGSIPQPSAKPEGFIGKRFSADGAHFVFGSKSKFEPDANEGEIAIYDRDLNTGETHVVSKTPAGETMKEEGKEIGELGISADGSRIVIGHLVEEVEGAKYWHLYMNIGDSGKTIDLTPGTTHGALFDGMTEDGSKVFFTTKDALTTAADQDTDHSADIYEAEVDGAGTMTPSRISTGTEGAGNTDACDPSANTKHEHWNTTGSEEDCGVVAIGGGGGVASDDGTIYFLSPELLDGTSEPEDGVQNAPNLYVRRPGGSPHFVGTLESSANAPLPPSAHPFIRSFGTFEKPAGVAIDHATGDIYLLDLESGFGGETVTVYKFDQLGHPVLTFGSHGKIVVGDADGFYDIPAGIAVDNDPGSSNYGDLYVPDMLSGNVRKFSSEGVPLSTIAAAGFPTAVAVDPANGNIYVANGFFGSSVQIFSPGGSQIESFGVEEFSHSPTGIAVDSSGNAYVVNGGGFFGASGTTEIYSPSGSHLKQLVEESSKAVAVDPSDGHIYVDEGDKATEFDASDSPFGSATGGGLISGSFGVAADSGELAISNFSKTNLALYGPGAVPPDPSTDNPLVVDSVSAPAQRNTADFQVNPSGEDAVFPSTLPLTSYDNGGHSEIFRYSDESDSLDCASCNPTGEQAVGEATLASNGSSLTDDGRVFFNTTEGLVDHDLNGKRDVYEWEKKAGESSGTVQRISTGTSPFDQSLLGVSADGTDAYFFTRDTLTSDDENGSTVKVYDARVDGGFPQVPPPIPCQASDECHGAGSQSPLPPNIKTIAGTPIGNFTKAPLNCKKKFVKRHGRCVRAHKTHHHRTHRHG